MLVRERGIDFEPTVDYVQEVRLAGGEDEEKVGFSRRSASSPQPLSGKTRPGCRLGCDGPPQSFVERLFPSGHTGRWGNARRQHSSSVFGSPAAGVAREGLSATQPANSATKSWVRMGGRP